MDFIETEAVEENNQPLIFYDHEEEKTFDSLKTSLMILCNKWMM